MIHLGDIQKPTGGRIAINEPMNRYTSIRIGGPADFFVEPRDRADALLLLSHLQEADLHQEQALRLFQPVGGIPEFRLQTLIGAIHTANRPDLLDRVVDSLCSSEAMLSCCLRDATYSMEKAFSPAQKETVIRACEGADQYSLLANRGFVETSRQKELFGQLRESNEWLRVFCDYGEFAEFVSGWDGDRPWLPEEHDAIRHLLKWMSQHDPSGRSSIYHSLNREKLLTVVSHPRGGHVADFLSHKKRKGP